MLTSCENCDLIVEIMKLESHLLRECLNRQFVTQCEKCGEVSINQH